MSRRLLAAFALAAAAYAPTGQLLAQEEAPAHGASASVPGGPVAASPFFGRRAVAGDGKSGARIDHHSC